MEHLVKQCWVPFLVAMQMGTCPDLTFSGCGCCFVREAKDSVSVCVCVCARMRVHAYICKYNIVSSLPFLVQQAYISQFLLSFRSTSSNLASDSQVLTSASLKETFKKHVHLRRNLDSSFHRCANI